MEQFTRKNAWNQNGTFDNPDLLWYAKAVQVMQSRPVSDPTSWWFYAAIHGEYLIHPVLIDLSPQKRNPVHAQFMLNWKNISYIPPSAQLDTPPSQNLTDIFWDQCQHGTWFFLPWHRGYLYALENILRDIIIHQLNGPGDWALPYWNYFGDENESYIPPAFTQKTLPDGTTPNPLYVAERYGPKKDGNIYIPISEWNINQNCQQDTVFTGQNPGHYGGGLTDFVHSGYNERGDLEDNPHNFVHVAIGGQNPAGDIGLMSKPNTAALDPVFYLHHCNIDRMWAVWNDAGKANPTDPNWLKGPAASGGRKFFMPKPDGSSWHYTPSMVNSISLLNYTYDDLSLGVPTEMENRITMRLRNLALEPDEVINIKTMVTNSPNELVGANIGTLKFTASGAHTTVNLDPAGWKKVSDSLLNVSTSNLPDEVYLYLEGVKGDAEATVFSVTVNHQYAGHISLFGLHNATSKDGHHAGTGLTIRLDITKIVDELHLNNAIDCDSLDVLIQPVNHFAQDSELTIDRVSVYRKSQK